MGRQPKVGRSLLIERQQDDSKNKENRLVSLTAASKVIKSKTIFEQERINKNIRASNQDLNEILTAASKTTTTRKKQPLFETNHSRSKVANISLFKPFDPSLANQTKKTDEKSYDYVRRTVKKLQNEKADQNKVKT